ncbi:MAG TPA: DUF2283 domain-containing protein [Isosphaeraceae bacterium]|nr:DUF2283 domain-containing protein [Isosphaeraceae bacterium]
MAMPQQVTTDKLTIDPESGAGYLQVTNNPVAYSIDLDDMVVADYDEMGNVVGVEFLDSKLGKGEVERYLNLAKTRTKGIAKGKRPQPPSA